MPLIVENEMYQMQANPLATGHAPPLNIQSQGHTSQHVQTTVVDTVHMQLACYRLQYTMLQCTCGLVFGLCEHIVVCQVFHTH